MIIDSTILTIIGAAGAILGIAGPTIGYFIAQGKKQVLAEQREKKIDDLLKLAKSNDERHAHPEEHGIGTMTLTKSHAQSSAQLMTLISEMRTTIEHNTAAMKNMASVSETTNKVMLLLIKRTAKGSING